MTTISDAITLVTRISQPVKRSIRTSNVIVMVAFSALIIGTGIYLVKRVRIGKRTIIDCTLGELDKMLSDIASSIKGLFIAKPKPNSPYPSSKMGPLKYTKQPTLPKFPKIIGIPPDTPKSEVRKHVDKIITEGSPLLTPVGSSSPDPASLTTPSPLSRLRYCHQACSTPMSAESRKRAFYNLPHKYQAELTPKIIAASIPINQSTSRLKSRLVGNIPMLDEGHAAEILESQHYNEIAPWITKAVEETLVNAENESCNPRAENYNFMNCLSYLMQKDCQEKNPKTALLLIKNIITHEDLSDFCMEKNCDAYTGWMFIPKCYYQTLLNYWKKTYPRVEVEKARDTDFLKPMQTELRRKCLLDALNHLEENPVDE